MSTPAPAHGRRFATTISRKLAIIASAVLAVGVLAAVPAHASALPDTVQLLGPFAVGADGIADSGTLYNNIHYANGNYQQWEQVEGNGDSQDFNIANFNGASIADMPDGSAQLVAVGIDGNLYFNIRYADGGWQGWAAVEGAAGSEYFNGSDPSITGMPDGSSQIIETGDDGNLYHNIRYANGTWQGWAPVEGVGGSKYLSDAFSSITGMPDGSSQIIATLAGTNETYHNIRYANGSWQGWARVEGNGASSYFVGFYPSITGMPDGSSQLIETGDDGNLYHNIRYANGTWQGWNAVGGLDGSTYFDGSAVIASLPDGSSQVFATVADSDNGAWEDTRASNGNWSGWTYVNGSIEVDAASGFGSVS
jgi:hypothetical protein